jgi:hypothetical protein
MQVSRIIDPQRNDIAELDIKFYVFLIVFVNGWNLLDKG